MPNRDEILCLLLNHGGDLCIKDNDGKTPLNILRSVDGQLYDIITHDHLCKNCEIDDLLSIERLHEMVQEHGPMDEFKQIFDQVPDDRLRYTDLGSKTLLYRACKAGWTDGVTFLLSRIDQVPPANTITNETPLHAACEGNHYDIVVELINKFPEFLLMKDKLPHRGWYPIHTACASGASDKILEIILSKLWFITKEMSNENKPNIHFIDAMGHSPLYIATKCGNISHINMMTDLLRFGELQQRIPSMYAITSGSVSQISVIHCAIVHNHHELLQILLDKIPLSVEVAAYPSVFSLSRMLRRLTNVVKTLNESDIFPLLNSTLYQYDDGELFVIDTTRTFKEHKTLCNIKMSPLAMSAAMGNMEMTEILIDAGAKDDDGLAVRISVFLHYYDIAKMLLVSDNNSNVCNANHDGKKLCVLPNIASLYQFTEMSLMGCNLTSLPFALFQNPVLKRLDVSDNKLTELPVADIVASSADGTWKCERLHMLNISSNKLRVLPSDVLKIPNLKYLHACENFIYEIEEPVTECRLSTIDISRNELRQVPKSAFAAKKVNISYNKLSILPHYIWKLTVLKDLNVSNNNIKQICFPKTSCSIRFSFTSTGQRVAQSDDNIPRRRTSSEVTTYQLGLHTLNLSNNKLTSFPEGLACVVLNLQNLNISGNHIPVLYVCLLPPKLKYLTAKGCSLKCVETEDPSINYCRHKNHSSLTWLVYLCLNNNFLCNISLQSTTLKFPMLKTLDLSSNQLQTLDSSIGKQASLQTLILDDNKFLKSLPLELSQLHGTLKHIALNNLPELKDLPQVYHNSPTRLLSYLKSRIKSSVSYRVVNLMIVGGNTTGKTILMRRLRKDNTKQSTTLDEVSICNWEYSTNTSATVINFKIWDFPNQKHNHMFDYCFYSKQAIYVVVFNLTNDEVKNDKIDHLLRNIKVHAPRCPVVIVGTHRDQINNTKEDDAQKIKQKYCDCSSYPEIADVCFVSNVKGYKYHGTSTIKLVRDKIYSIATHLYIDGKQRLKLENDKQGNDPDALIQLMIPQSYVCLQRKIYDEALKMKQKKVAPMMNKNEFYECFLPLMEDEEELASAVDFLHHQREILHFKDADIKSYYFLDIQWISNTMIKISKMENSENGTTVNGELISQSPFSVLEHLQAGLLMLLKKFDFAIPWNSNYTLVYCLLPVFTTDQKRDKHLYNNASSITVTDIFPSASESISRDSSSNTANFHNLHILDSFSFENSIDLSIPNQLNHAEPCLKAKELDPVLFPPLHRIWFAAFIPDGFWPQLFTRIIADGGINSALSAILHTAIENQECVMRHASSSVPSVWKLYQKRCEIEYDDIKLIELKQVENIIISSKDINNLSDQYANQIELNVNIRNIALVHNSYGKNQSSGSKAVLKLATRILIFIEQHILDIGSEWFPGTICCDRNKEVLSYIPCPLCLSYDNSAVPDVDSTHQIICCNGCQVICFSLKKLLTAYAMPSMSINCPVHSEYKFPVHLLAPDMCFKDLDEEFVCGPDIPLIIDAEKMLGSGGSAIVLRGEIKMSDKRQLVAVKVLAGGLGHIKHLEDFLRSCTASVENYRVIRKEVLFQSALRHDNLTQLCGVRTIPYLFLMELAPLGCLNSILKQYRAANSVLTPTVLQASMCQIASALAFLHEQHIIYRDLKSDNVLAWKFPMPNHPNIYQDVLVKITDYGISTISSVSQELKCDSIPGTQGFIAPEVYDAFQGQQVLQSDKIDVFSFGMFVYELVALLKPFEFNSEQPTELILRQLRPEIPETAKENFTPCLIHKIMKCCWCHDPRKRPSMVQVLKWSELPELCFLRFNYNLKPKKLSCICQCLVKRDNLPEYSTTNFPNLQQTFPNIEDFPQLFFSIKSQTPPADRKNSTVNYHTQVWVAQDFDDRYSELKIFTFRCSDIGYRVHTDMSIKVTAMANVGDYMWVCTVDHKLYIVHTAQMKTISCVRLENLLLEVIQLLHVPEWHMVLVLWELSEIWCLYDEVPTLGVLLIGKLQLHKNNPISMLCKIQFLQATEVWATRKDKEIVVLRQSPTECTESEVLKCSIAEKKKSYNCNLIEALTLQIGPAKKSATHVWVSFEGSSQLVCWKADDKTQLQSVSLRGENVQVTALLGHKNHLYVGTSLGSVEVFDSPSGQFLQHVQWHGNKVQSLIELPPEICQSICVEQFSLTYKSQSRRNTLTTDAIVPRRRVSQESHKQRCSTLGSQLSYKSGLNYPCPLIVSLGKGLAESLNFNNQISESDLQFMTWSGLPHR